MEKAGATVSIIDLPTPDAPAPDQWQHALQSQITTLDADTYFVAHSLGSITLLKFLEKATLKDAIGGYILVSGFNARLPQLPELDSFTSPSIDCDRLTQITDNRVVIAAIDDPIVPYALSRELATCLQAKFVPAEHGGHFLGSDGFTEFPLVLAELQNIAARARR